MSRLLPIIIGLMLAPAGLHAQGLAIDFDADAFETEASPRQEADAAAAAPASNVESARRPVRYGKRPALTGVAPSIDHLRVADAGTRD